jgi:hypothetical protein
MARMHRCFAITSSLVAIAFLGCHQMRYGPMSMSTSGFRFSAGSAVVGPASDTLRVAVVVVNESRDQRELAIPTCPPVLNQVQATVTAKGRKWNSVSYDKRQWSGYFDSTGNEIPHACLAYLRVMILPPGASNTYVLKVPVREVLGDSLAAGRYTVKARLSINGDIIRGLPGSTVELSSPPI